MVPQSVIVWGIGSVITCVIISMCIICYSLKYDSRRRSRCNERQRRITRTQLTRNMQLIAQPDQNSIYNISGRVQGQNQTQYPDAYLSVEHITITNELNKPPKYDDAPPTYEEAIKLAMAHSNSIQTFQAEQPQASQQAHSSTSTLTAAVPNQTTE